MRAALKCIAGAQQCPQGSRLGPCLFGDRQHKLLASRARNVTTPFLRQSNSQVLSSTRRSHQARPHSVTVSASSYNVQMQVYADYTDEAIGKPNLDIKFVDANTAGRVSDPVSMSGFDAQPYQLEYRVGPYTREGVTLSGQVILPPNFGTAGACLITFKKSNSNSKIDRVYIAKLVATPVGAPADKAITFLANSWVASSNPQTVLEDSAGRDSEGRVFFTGTPCLPKNTPPGLQKYRENELATLRGQGVTKTLREGAQRIYQYDVYNDLGGQDEATNVTAQRPVLGMDPARGGTLPYPRRLFTGRQTVKIEDGPFKGQVMEVNPSGIPWLPYDEQFFASKQDEFSVGTIYAVGEAASSIIEQLFHDKEEITRFAGFFAVDDLYTRDTPVPKTKSVVLKNADSSPFRKVKDADMDKLREAYLKFPADVRKAIEARLESPPGIIQKIIRFFFPTLDEKIVAFLQGLVETWPPPLVRDQRKVTWQTDEEVGRQAVAGCNPFTIQIATPSFLDSEKRAVKDKDVACLLDGLTLEKAVEHGRLFFQDYHSVLADDIAPQVQKRYDDLKKADKDPGSVVGHQYAGVGIFFKCAETGAMPIVAIELTDPATTKTRVFSPVKDRPEVWELAKAVYSTLDAAVHQLVSHFGETHAVMEPFAIATRRQLSAMHPVFQLLQPHFRYTLSINANARSSLINAGGVVEKVFTAGPFAMEFSAKMYGATWKFNEQGLPYDLEARGLASFSNGQPTWALDDFPFAEDGLKVWNAIVEYFDEYLRLYYSDDGSDGKIKVTDDIELSKWYKEIQREGHPDVQDGWFQLKDIESLVNILATMAWIGSAHHAAVNFGQYAYQGYMPNKASYIAHAIPEPGTDEEQRLLNDFEFEFLATLSAPIRAVQTMLLTKLLSIHAQDEVYLSTETPEWILDPAGQKVHKKFVEKLKQAEQEMIAANDATNPASRARSSPAGVAYRLMYPSTVTEPVTPDNKGMTGRGIPYSVSI